MRESLRRRDADGRDRARADRLARHRAVRRAEPGASAEGRGRCAGDHPAAEERRRGVARGGAECRDRARRSRIVPPSSIAAASPGPGRPPNCARTRLCASDCWEPDVSEPLIVLDKLKKVYTRGRFSRTPTFTLAGRSHNRRARHRRRGRAERCRQNHAVRDDDRLERADRRQACSSPAPTSIASNTASATGSRSIIISPTRSGISARWCRPSCWPPRPARSRWCICSTSRNSIRRTAISASCWISSASCAPKGGSSSSACIRPRAITWKSCPRLRNGSCLVSNGGVTPHPTFKSLIGDERCRTYLGPEMIRIAGTTGMSSFGNGQVALVTGAAGAMGLATASMLAAEGYRVAMADLPGGKLDAAAASIGANARGFGFDVSDPAATEKAFKRHRKRARPGRRADQQCRHPVEQQGRRNHAR